MSEEGKDLGQELIEHLHGQEPEQNEGIEIPPQMRYGVSVFEMQDGEPIMHIHTGPDVEDVSVGELWRLIAQVKQNLELELQSAKFMQVMDNMRHQAQTKPRIIQPGR